MGRTRRTSRRAVAARRPGALDAGSDDEGSLLLCGERFVFLSEPNEVPTSSRRAGLTAAEEAVAQLAVFGLSNAEIAEARGASLSTVANQLASVYRKLGVGSRIELIAALDAGAPLSDG
jgi:DNA-binding CsgD family transcriptional regulator